jgi:hypothetical protein
LFFLRTGMKYQYSFLYEKDRRGEAGMKYRQKNNNKNKIKI